MFELDAEVIVSDDEADCIDKIRHYLSRDDQHQAMARTARPRTVRDHAYKTRLAELLDMLKRRA